ncbi:unnamed protein product [Lactuca saligna]|uniref:Uncharacterized protein n=1 Tax=Lactuca saligna TaxID=75948 RepID=A0AA35Z8F6_LACSI|nr:unnamed protein product [Lactuca saligna]
MKAVTKVVERHQSLISKNEEKESEDVLNFEKIGFLLGELKEIVSKSTTASGLTLEFLTQKFNSLEASITKPVAPLSKFANILPTGAPLVVTGVQGGRNGFSCTVEGLPPTVEGLLPTVEGLLPIVCAVKVIAD